MSDPVPPPVPNPSLPSAIPPGWYADPQMMGTQRYWDGNAWTEHRVPIAPVIRPAHNGIAIAALVLGLVSILSISVSGIPFLLGLLAVIFGGVGIQRSKAMAGRGGAMGIWGIILGCLTMAGAITRIIFA